MSEFNCPVVQIKNLKPVPNSDALEMTTVFETPVIVRKGQLQVGDLAVYIPVESMVPMTKPQFQGLGIKTEREIYRVKAVRLRGTYSEGLLVPVDSRWFSGGDWSWSVGKDMAPEWGITKYEEPEETIPLNGKVSSLPAKEIKWAPKYSVENLLRKREDLPVGTYIEVTEKLHGCNGRFVYGRGVDGIERLHVGSHNIWKTPQYQTKYLGLKKFVNRFFPDTFKLEPTNTDVWYNIARKYDLANKLKNEPMLVVYGEVIGKVQDLKYGLGDDVDFRVFAMYDADEKVWYDPIDVREICEALNLPYVPVIFEGPYDPAVVDEMRHGVNGKSRLDGNTICEGIVIKKLKSNGYNTALKYVSENYKLRKNGTEFH